MALIGNYSVLNKSNTRYSNGTSTAGAYAGNTRSNWNNPTQQFAKVYNSFPPRTSIPEGYNVGEAYTRARKSGGLASFLSGSGSLVGTGTNARLSDATMSGVGSLTANLGAIVQAATSFDGVGSLTANLGILSGMSSSLSGSGSLSANLSALVGLSSNLSGSGAIVSDLKGTGSLSAAITIGGTGYLSNDDVSRLSDAVWDEVIADHSTAGTTGKALQDAGSAGNPWSALIASNNTPDTFGWFVQKLLTVAKFLGLK
jgi:hypothetical protein